MPFFNIVGKWYYYIFPFDNISYIYDLFEVIVMIGILINAKNYDAFFIFLLFYPMSAMPSLLNTVNNEGFIRSFYYIILISCGAGAYSLFKQTKTNIFNKSIIDYTVLIWTIVGLFYKFMSGISSGVGFLMSRSGGLWASNHQASIVFLLLPFVKIKWIRWTAISLLLLHFSRGVFACLFLYFILEILVEKRIVLKDILIITTILIIVIGLLLFAFPDIFILILKFLMLRLIFGGAGGNSLVLIQDLDLSNLSFNHILQAILLDDRFVLAQKAIDIIYKTKFIGIGLGGYIDGLEQLGFPAVYSNAHNVYLTILAEGGVLFFLFFIGMLIFITLKAFKNEKKAFISLILFIIYGLFSGQIYESGFEKSVIDYYYLIFIFSCSFNENINEQYYGK